MKAHWKYIVVSLIIGWFIGASSGILGMRCMTHGGKPGRMRERVFKDLKLTVEQKAHVEAVLQNSRMKIDGIRNQARQDIRVKLSPEQQATFDAANARQDAKRNKWKERRKR